jgi:tRNA modification GTPase
VSLLTPPGSGAIATVEVSGPRAWDVARTLFRPAGRPLPETPELHRFSFGTLGEGTGDEVILVVTAVDSLPSGDGSLSPGEPRPQGSGSTVEVHCHGGRQVVRWVIEQFVSLGCVESKPTAGDPGAFELLQHAPTLRTAGILLDQLHGVFDLTVRRILASPALVGLDELARFAPIGRHLVEPWKVVVAGAPNVGKSSLVNALAGYQRAVVSEVAGTTRDAVGVQLALDGWPVELIDTAGLRDAEGLEAEGIARAKRVLSEADLVLWVMDGSEHPVTDVRDSPGLLVVWNKSDLSHSERPGLNVSAKTGSGIPALTSEIVRLLVSDPPSPGAAVPYSSQLADRVQAAQSALTAGYADEAARLLRDCLQSD